MSFLSVCSMAGMRTLEKMFVYFPVIYLLVVAASSTPILVSECGTLDVPFANYQLSQDISISSNEELVCFDIRSNGITLDGNGFGISSVSEQLIPATGVKFSGSSVTVKNLKISNLRTGVHANGKYGKVEYNTITQAVNGIDVTETHNDISYNTIKNFDAAESAAGIYVYFPAISPVASFINITNNVISDIRGDSFVQGISVYYATSVNIANNRIFNLAGDLKTESISLIQSEAENTDNVFISPSSGGSAFVLSCILVVASVLWFFSPAAITSSPLPTPIPIPFPTSALDQAKEEEKEKKEKEEENKEKEKESEDDMEMDGADVRVRKSKLSFSVGSSPPVKSPSL